MKIRNLSAIMLSFVLALGSLSFSYADDFTEDSQPAEETEEIFAETEETPEEAAEAEETDVPDETEENKEGAAEFKTLMRAPEKSVGFTDNSLFTNADLASSNASENSYSYRALLSDDEKKIYDLIDGSLNYKDIVYGTIYYSNGTTVNTYMDAVSAEISDAGIYFDNDDDAWAAAANIGIAYLYDNPEYSWISNVAYGMTITSTDNFVTYEIFSLDFQFIAVSDAETVAENIAVFDAWKDNVVSGASKYTNYYDKLKYAHDALCNQTSYNFDSLEYDSFDVELFRYSHAPIGIIALNKQVVCEGYSKTFKIICDELDIPCLFLTSDIHMWNIVKMEDGEWYGIDVTWDDDNDNSSIYYNYFLKGTGVFNSEPEDRGYYTNPFSFSLSYDDYVLTTTTTTETSTETTTTSTTTSTTETSTTTSTTETTTETSTETTTETASEEEIFVAAPGFTVVGVFGGRDVTFYSDTEDAVIYYSAEDLTDGYVPISNGTTISFKDFYGTVYAQAYKDGSWSDISRLILKIPVTAAPEITVDGSRVTIASGTPSSFVCYTTDGTEPVVEPDGTITNGTWIRNNGARINYGTITVDPGTTVKAIAVRSCFTNSVSASAYVPVGSPQFTVVGAYGGRNVTFTSSTEGAVIYYSADDYVLSTSDIKVSNGETILFEDFYGTIYARAYYNGTWSDVSRLILKIPVVDAPEVTYEGNVVRLVSSTKDSFICYTTDGTDPVVKPDGTVTNGTWIKVNGARTTKGSITVSSGTTVKAIAIRNCFTNSSISSCTVS